MIHNEFLNTSWESWEIFKAHNDDVLHIYIKNNEAIIFKSLMDFYNYIEQGNPNIIRIYCYEDELPEIYSIFDNIQEEYDEMDFLILKEIIELRNTEYYEKEIMSKKDHEKQYKEFIDFMVEEHTIL